MIIGGGGRNNCEPTASGETVWAAERLQLEDVDFEKFQELAGALQADYLYGKTNGDVRALVLNFTDQVWGQMITDGFIAELERLGAGEPVAILDLANADFINGTAVQKFSTAILQATDANSIIVPIDGWMSGSGFGAAVVQSGRSDELFVVGIGGGGGALDLIRENAGLDATVGYASSWGAWGSVDEAIRLLNGEDLQIEGDGYQVVDADNNMPASGGYQGPADFEAVYTALWGVS
jgi:ribose transport system substrate-binding protein